MGGQISYLEENTQAVSFISMLLSCALDIVPRGACISPIDSYRGSSIQAPAWIKSEAVYQQMMARSSNITKYLDKQNLT